jgi:hypothetical protein
MNIVVILEDAVVKEVIVPDESVKVVVLDFDAAGGAEVVEVGGDYAAIDAMAHVRQTVNAARLNKLLQDLHKGLDQLPDTDDVAAVRRLLRDYDARG